MTQRIREELESLWEISPKSPDVIVFRVNNTIKTAFKSLGNETGIHGFRFHDCRHTATTRMIMAGGHTEVMKITGDSQLKTFLRYLNVKAEKESRLRFGHVYVQGVCLPLVSDRLN